MDRLTPGFVVAHSHRLEDLTDIAVKLMTTYPLAPFDDEVVLVQSNGIAQWLKTELARHTGVAAMLDISLPARFVWRAYRAVLGEQIPRHSPYDKARLRWRLMRLLPLLMTDNSHVEVHFRALAGYVADDPDQRKLFQLSDKLADLFDQYQVYRADWLDAWARGEDTLIHRGQARPLEPQHRWQPFLWRALIEDIGAEDICSNRAALHQHFVQTASALTERPDGIPPRLIVFGISSLPRQTLEVLNALKGVCQVMLCVHNPCQYHWGDIVDGRELFRQQLIARQRDKQQSLASLNMDELHLHAQPLLASWGKQGRDYIRLLDEFDETRQKAADFTDLRFDLFDETPPRTLLQQLQSDILHLRPLHETHELWQRQVAAQDRSICFHRCHSPQREVEVLHDQLLAAFAADPQLQPRDIMVMVPDINTYAPYIEAVFGQRKPGDPRYIPYTLADQGQRHRNPVLIALEYVLAAPQQRFTYSELFDLLHVAAIQQRFGIELSDVERLQQWLAGAGARWGLHAEHRRSVGIHFSYSENSWQFALQRLLYGYAAGEVAAEPWHSIEPYTEASGMQAGALGGLAVLVRTLEYYWQQMAQPRCARDWHTLLNSLLDDLFSPQDDADYLLISRLRDALDDWFESTDEAGFEDMLRYNIVQEVWLSAMDEGGLNQRFMAGSVNFATLMPMRAIPFKRVCLLGMNETDYPRSSQSTDFDLMSGHYQPGDRSRRDDDRYLFLEALLSAREQFYISWVGLSAQDNSDLPPSVLIGQLQEHLNAGWDQVPPENKKDVVPLSQRLTTVHRLQPFSPVYFNTAQPAAGAMFTYAHEWAAVHNAQIATPEPDGELTEYEAQAPLLLRDLEVWFKEPAQLLARRRLGVFIDRPEYELYDDEVFAADGLSYWQLKQSLLTEAMAEQPDSQGQLSRLLEQRAQRIRREGQLPYGHASDEMEAEARIAVENIYAQLLSVSQSGFALRAPLVIDLETDGIGISDELTSVYQHKTQNERWLYVDMRVSQVVEQRPRSVVFKHNHLCHGWLAHLCATLSAPAEIELETLIIGEGGGVRFTALNRETARDILTGYVQLLRTALRSPQPVALSLGREWLGKKPAARTEMLLQSLYEGSAYSAGLREQLAYLARHFADAEALSDSGFDNVCEHYYQRFFTALEQASIELQRELQGETQG